MPGLCIKSCVTNLALYLTTSLFLFLFRTKTHLNPTGNVLGGVGITYVNTFLFLSELRSASIVSFHLFQFKRFLHSVMVLGSGSLKNFQQ
jgi:hypothetical protein